MNRQNAEEFFFVASTEESESSNAIKTLQLNYNSLHSPHIVTCRLENQCRITNENRISQLLCTYSDKIRDSKISLDSGISYLLSSFQEASQNDETLFNLLDVQPETNSLVTSALPNVHNQEDPLSNVSNINNFEMNGNF